MYPAFDTATLSGGRQRSFPVEQIGCLISTAGTVPYVHLQLAQARRLHGDGFPLVVANDNHGLGGEEIEKLCADYGAAYITYDEPIGHTTGDLRNIWEGLKWADVNNIQLLVKLSRRYVPLVHYRNQLAYLASTNLDAAAFTRRNSDRPDGMFRTDCIALRTRKWVQSDRAREVIEESLSRHWRQLQVEPLLLSLAEVSGGWAHWDMVGKAIHTPHDKALQWRGILPHYYADLSRELGLPYTDNDFCGGAFYTPDDVDQANDDKYQCAEGRPVLSDAKKMVVVEEPPREEPASS